MINIIDARTLEAIQDEIGAWYYTLNGIAYTGCAIQEYPIGNKIAEHNLLEGYQEGIQRIWYPNGQLKTEFIMKINIHHGVSKEYYENGVLYYETECDMGKRIWSKMYNEKGELIEEFPSSLIE